VPHRRACGGAPRKTVRTAPTSSEPAERSRVPRPQVVGGLFIGCHSARPVRMRVRVRRVVWVPRPIRPVQTTIMYPWMGPTYSAYGRSGAGEPSVLARVEEEPKGRDRALVGLEELGEAEASARQLGVVPATPTSSGRGPTKPSQPAMPSSTRLTLRRNPGERTGLSAIRRLAGWSSSASTARRADRRERLEGQ
jgi:hypothetical protein